MRSALQDVGHLCRTARKSHGFFGAAVLALALGIGANHARIAAVQPPQGWVDEGWAPWERELTAHRFLPEDTIFVLRVAAQGPA
jgi:hypothetical protein